MYDGGGFCDECVTELQERRVQDDVKLASCAAELAWNVGATRDQAVLAPVELDSIEGDALVAISKPV